MKEDWEKLFSQLEPPEPPPGLLGKVINRIAKERRISAARRRLIVFSFFFLAAGAALIPSFRLLQSGLAESGFPKLFSLVFSDSAAVASHWQSFIFALLESLPATSIVFFLAAVFVFLNVLKYLALNIGNINKIQISAIKYQNEISK